MIDVRARFLRVLDAGIACGHLSPAEALGKASRSRRPRLDLQRVSPAGLPRAGLGHAGRLLRLQHLGGAAMKPYYVDDAVTLYHGDCREVTGWLEADVLVTDPPYGMGYLSNARVRRIKHRAIAGDETTAARDDALIAWGARPALVFGTWKTPKPAGVRLTLTWDKRPSVGSGDITMPWGLSTEDIYVLGPWPPIKPGGRAREGGSPTRASSVIRVSHYSTQAIDRPDHPTPKPVALMERLLLKCPPGVIADPFAGSGSTLVAAKQLGRKAIGVEIDESYCELAARRLSQDVLFTEEPA